MCFSAKETAIFVIGEICSSLCIRAAAAGFKQGIMEAFKVQNPFPKQELALKPSAKALPLHHLFSFSLYTKEQMIVTAYSVYLQSFLLLYHIRRLPWTHHSITQQEKEPSMSSYE